MWLSLYPKYYPVIKVASAEFPQQGRCSVYVQRREVRVLTGFVVRDAPFRLV